MRIEILYSPSNNIKEAYSHFANQLEQINFEPNFLLLFLTEKVWKNYRVFIELLKKRFPNTKMLGCTVGGYLVRDEVWTRGVATLLGEFDGKVDVFWVKDKTATRAAERLGEKIGKGWDTILLMFPAFYFPGKFQFLRAFINDRRYYRAFKNKKSLEEKEKVLTDYSKYLESKFIFPINKILKTLAEKTGKKAPIIGMNLVPLEAQSYTPLILANYENAGRCAAALCFKGKVNTIFHDIFPERGKSYEETLEVVKGFFSVIEEVRVIKSGVTLGEINEMKPVDFLKMKVLGFKDVRQDEFLKRLENGKLLMETPYGVNFVSERTFGSIYLGLIAYPVNLYPSLFDFNGFYNSALFVGETFRGGIKAFGKIFEKKRFNGFDFFILDHSAVMSFGGDIHRLLDIIREKSKSYFGVLSSYPSVYLPNPDRRYISEIDDGICANLTGTSVILEFI